MSGPPLRLGAFGVAVALGTATSAGAQTPIGSTAVLNERVVVEYGPEKRGASGRVRGFVAGHGLLAWLEPPNAGSSLDPRLSRVVVHDGTRTRRGDWARGRYALSIERRADSATNRLVVRLVLTRTTIRGKVSRAFLSPRTLRSTSARWESLTAANVITDGERTLSGVTEPGSAPASLPASADGSAVRSQCRISGLADVTLPPVPNCVFSGGSLRGPLILVRSTVDLGLEIPSATSASFLFDLRRPTLGWRRVAEGMGFGGKSSGAQNVCLLDEGVAILSGTRDSYALDDPRTWGLSFVPADPAREGWTAATPQLSPSYRNHTAFGCNGPAVYASYVDITRSASGRTRERARVVELRPGELRR